MPRPEMSGDRPDTRAAGNERHDLHGQPAAHALDGISAHSRAVSQRHRLPEERFFSDFEREAEPGSDQVRLATSCGISSTMPTAAA